MLADKVMALDGKEEEINLYSFALDKTPAVEKHIRSAHTLLQHGQLYVIQ